MISAITYSYKFYVYSIHENNSLIHFYFFFCYLFQGNSLGLYALAWVQTVCTALTGDFLASLMYRALSHESTIATFLRFHLHRRLGRAR